LRQVPELSPGAALQKGKAAARFSAGADLPGWPKKLPETIELEIN